MFDSNRSGPLAALSVADLKGQLATLLQDAKANAPLQRAFSWAVNRLDPAAPLLVICGHVCSGKSSLINALLGDDILPVSPVPLSAIPVFISYGDAAAVAYFLDGTAIALDGAGLYEAAAGKINGVTHLTVTLPSPFLKQGVVLVDSPPLDHPLQSVRETAALLQEQADIAFLLMDYKRVQTGENQHALQQFNDLGIPVITLVTQMDKHSAAEIPLDDYKSATMRWLVEAGGHRQLLSFISLRQINGMDGIQEALRTILFSATLATKARRDQTSQRLLARLAAAIGIDEYQQLAATVDQCRRRKGELADQLLHLRKLPDTVAARVLEAMEGVLPEAIISRSLREFGEGLVESCLPSFRVGIFNLRRARERIRQQRLNLFMEEFSRQAESALVKKARGIVAEQLAPLYAPGPTGQRALNGITLRIPPAAILQLALQHRGVGEPGSYFFSRFSALTSNALLTAVRQALVVLQAEIVEYCDARIALLELELHNITSELQFKSAEMNNYAAGHQLVERIAALLVALSTVPANIEEPLAQPAKPLTPYRPPPSATATQTTDDTAVHRPELSVGAPLRVLRQYREEKTALLLALNGARAIISRASSTAEAAALHRLSSDISDDQLRVTVFGAVSSGKSTLTNALIGRRLLLSSANRTTALPTHLVASANSTERVVALFKSLPELATEVESALLALGYQGKAINLLDPDGAKTLLAVAHELSHAATAKDQQAAEFLGTVANALLTDVNRLGSKLELPLERFREVLALAEGTALVREIQLEIAAEFLANGVHLVDTPGIGNFNGRQAETTFQLLLDSDAVIFVSYYNQGLSHADLQFLLLLQRINTILCRDNIFFVVAAADLAGGNAQEISEVTAHLGQLLHEQGLADQRIDPVAADLFLLTGAIAQATSDHDLLDLYKHRAMTDRFAAIPNPGLNLTASGIPGFVDKLETFLVSRNRPMLANGQAATVDALAEILFVKTRILWLMGQDPPGYQRQGQVYRESLQEAHHALAELADELGSSVEGALARVSKERAKVLHLSRLLLEAEVPLLLTELLAPIDPARLSLEQFKQELLRAAHAFFVQVAADCAQEQRLAALQMFQMFVREALVIEKHSASQIAAIKGNIAKTALAEVRQFAHDKPGLAEKLTFAGFGAKEFEAGELAKQVSSSIDLVKRGDELKSTLRQALQVTVTAELADLFVAMELDLEDVLDSRSAEFYSLLCKELEGRLELYLQGCRAGFARLERFHAMDAEGQAAERRALEREIAEIAGAVDAVEQIRL